MESNVLDLSQVRAVVFKVTGDIAKFYTSDENQKIKRLVYKACSPIES